MIRVIIPMLIFSCFIASLLSCTSSSLKNEKELRQFNGLNEKEYQFLEKDDSVRILSHSFSFKSIDELLIQFKEINLKAFFDQSSKYRELIFAKGEHINYDKLVDYSEGIEILCFPEDTMFYSKKMGMLKIEKRSPEISIYLVKSQENFSYLFLKIPKIHFVQSGLFFDKEKVIILFHSSTTRNGILEFPLEVSALSFIDLKNKEMVHMEYLDHIYFNEIFICDFSDLPFKFFKGPIFRPGEVPRIDESEITMDFYFQSLNNYRSKQFYLFDANEDYFVVDNIKMLVK